MDEDIGGLEDRIGKEPQFQAGTDGLVLDVG